MRFSLRHPAIPRGRGPTLTFGALAAVLAVAVGLLLVDLPDPGALIQRAAPDATKIYDRHGRLLYEILDPRAGRRNRVPLSGVPPSFRHAVVDVEDAGFYDNPGVDLRGVARAAWQMARERRIVSGGSTITQQLARDVLLSAQERNRRSFRRKLREMILALRMNRRFEKDQILELYVNEVYFGQMAYGVDAAARTYFGVPARDLDLAQSALLAGLIQSPATYNPFVDVDAARERRRVVLGLMERAGDISVDQAAAAAAEPIHLSSGAVGLEAPHFVNWVRSSLEARYGAEGVSRGGLQVVTSLDLDLQHQAEAIVKRRIGALNRPAPGTPDHHAGDAALVAVDPATGEVLAMVGSADYFDPAIDGAVNIALARRQPGSAIKPITYATAFDTGRWGARPTGGTPGRPSLPFTPATVLSDVPTTFTTKENEPYRPMNYDRMWHGPISLRRALATSSNLVAVKVLNAVGVDAMIDTARRAGITTFADSDRFGLALTLGGGEVRLLELTAAYGALAAEGRRVDPVAILGVLSNDAFRTWQANGADASALRRGSAGPDASQVSASALSRQVAYLVTDILADDEARLPAFGEGSVLNIGRPAAAKTGTTTDFRDNWTLGYTPDLVAGVWVGNADGSPMAYVSGISGAGPIWHDFMVMATAGQPVRGFRRPDGIDRVEICDASGLLPTPACRRVRAEVFVHGTAPTAADNAYVEVDLDAATGLAWAPGCDGPKSRTVFRLLPPDAAEWGRDAGIPTPPEETCDGHGAAGVLDPGGTQGALSVGPASAGSSPAVSQPGSRGPARVAGFPLVDIVQPAARTVFALDPGLPRSAQQIELRARLGPGVQARRVDLVLDGRTVASLRRPPFSTHWPLATGQHVASALVVNADGSTVGSQDVTFSVLSTQQNQEAAP